MRHMSRAALQEWMPFIVASVVLVWVCVATILITLHVASIDQGLIAQQKADHQTMINHAALLKRVETDEVKACTAARASGDQQVIAIICPAGG